jgi:hypothetical protein
MCLATLLLSINDQLAIIASGESFVVEDEDIPSLPSIFSL